MAPPLRVTVSSDDDMPAACKRPAPGSFNPGQKRLNTLGSTGWQPAEDPARMCVVCMAEPKVGVFLPCMHKCCCMTCGDLVMRQIYNAVCPICRSAADRFAFVYE